MSESARSCSELQAVQNSPERAESGFTPASKSLKKPLLMRSVRATSTTNWNRGRAGTWVFCGPETTMFLEA